MDFLVKEAIVMQSHSFPLAGVLFVLDHDMLTGDGLGLLGRIGTRGVDTKEGGIVRRGSQGIDIHGGGAWCVGHVLAVVCPPTLRLIPVLC
jgi:hypothetical protein